MGVASLPSGAAAFRFAAGLRCLGTCRSLAVGRQGRGSNPLYSPIFLTNNLIGCKMYDSHTVYLPDGDCKGLLCRILRPGGAVRRLECAPQIRRRHSKGVQPAVGLYTVTRRCSLLRKACSTADAIERPNSLVFTPDEANQQPRSSQSRHKDGHQLLWGAGSLRCDRLKPGTCRRRRTLQVCLHTQKLPNQLKPWLKAEADLITAM